jgi:hypothetical protein
MRPTPEQTRTHRVARAVARDLIQLSGSGPRPEPRELADRFGMLPSGSEAEWHGVAIWSFMYPLARKGQLACR